MYVISVIHLLLLTIFETIILNTLYSQHIEKHILRSNLNNIFDVLQNQDKIDKKNFDNKKAKIRNLQVNNESKRNPRLNMLRLNLLIFSVTLLVAINFLIMTISLLVNFNPIYMILENVLIVLTTITAKFILTKYIILDYKYM